MGIRDLGTYRVRQEPEHMLRLEIMPLLENREPTRFEKFKIKVWNFILPPHMRLGYTANRNNGKESLQHKP